MPAKKMVMNVTVRGMGRFTELLELQAEIEWVRAANYKRQRKGKKLKYGPKTILELRNRIRRIRLETDPIEKNDGEENV